VLADLAPRAGDAAEARVLAGRLGGLPLALHQAGTYLGSPFSAEPTFSAYGQALLERFGDLLGRGDDDRGQVIGTWELSLDALAAQGRGQARELLRVLSCFAAAVPVPPVLLDPGVLSDCCGGEGRVEEGLSGLLSVGLIETRDPGGEAGRPLVVVHPLVAQTIRYQAADALADSFAVAVDLLATAAGHLDYEDPRDQARWLALLPHLRALLGLEVAASAAVLETLASSAATMSLALLRGGSYPASLELAESALTRTAALGEDHEQIFDLLVRRAAAHRFLGHAAEAEAEFRQVLAAQLRVLGPDHPSTLATRQEIARTLADQGKPAEAEAEFRQVLAARLRVLSADHYDTLATGHYIARTLAGQGKLAEAEAEFRQVLAGKVRVLGPDHPSTLATRHRIACVLADQGKFAEAEAEFQQVLAARLRVLGPDHPDTLDSRYEIARMFADQGKLAEAEAELRQVLAARLRVLGPDHPSTLLTKELIQRFWRQDD